MGIVGVLSKGGRGLGTEYLYFLPVKVAIYRGYGLSHQTTQ